MSAPPIPIKVVEVPMPAPQPASPPPFYVQPKAKKSSPCRWTTLALVVLLVWLTASALILVHLGPECLFKKFYGKSEDESVMTEALKSTQLDDLSNNNVVDSLDKLLNSAKLRQIVVLTTDDESDKSDKPEARSNVVDNDVDEQQQEEKQQNPLKVIDSSTGNLENTAPYHQGSLGSMQGIFVPAEHIFGDRPAHPYEAMQRVYGMHPRPQWSPYEQMETPRFQQPPPAFYPHYQLQYQNPYYNPFFRPQPEQFHPQFYYPQQQQNAQNFFQQQQQQQQQNPQNFFQQAQPAQQNPRPILAIDPNPLQWPQQAPSSTEAPAKSDSNEIFRKVEEEMTKNQAQAQQPQLISASLGADIRDEIYRQLQRQSQLLSGAQERPMPAAVWSPVSTTTEAPADEAPADEAPAAENIDEIYRKLQEQSQKAQEEKEKEKEEEDAFEHVDVVEDSFPRLEKINVPEATSTEAPAPERTTEDSSFFKFFEEQAAKMREALSKQQQSEEVTISVDADTKDQPEEEKPQEEATEAPMEEPKAALIFQDSSEPQEEPAKETKETQVAWTKDQEPLEPVQGDTEDKSMVRAERTN